MPSPGHKRLLVYSYGMFDFDLILRLRPGLARRGWSVAFVTHLLSVWLRAGMEGIPCTLLRRTTAAPPAADFAFEATPEGLLDLLSPMAAERYRASAWEALGRARAGQPVVALAQWNGLRLGGQVATAYARANGLPTVFLELGNIEPKLFADPEGVNAASRLAAHPEMLDRYEVDDDEIAAWRQALIARKRAATIIPQARRIMKINPWFPADWFGALVLGIPQPLSMSVAQRVAMRWRLTRRRLPPPVRPTEPYLFAPLQVSEDTNLLLFSKYDNRDLIAHAAAQARARGLKLVVKPHPAERDVALLEDIAALCAREGHLLTSHNTTDLIERSEEVITINSTVGLEAIAMGKPVSVLGESHYAGFSARQAAIYAIAHLLDVSPFGTEPASPQAVDRLIEILEAPADAPSTGRARDTGPARATAN